MAVMAIFTGDGFTKQMYEALGFAGTVKIAGMERAA